MQAQRSPSDQSKLNEHTPRSTRNKNERPWTAVDKHKLRGLIERGVPEGKIARVLGRPLGSITALANSLGVTRK